MLKIVLSGRGLALTVQLFGRAAGGCGLCAETLALLALGILALEESLAGNLVRLGRGEGIYGNGACFLRFVVVEIDLDLTVLELSARKSDIDLLTVSFLLSNLEILLLGEEHGHMAGDAVLIAEIDAVCDRARHEAAICQIHLTVVLLDDLEFDLVVEELEVRPGRLFLDIGVLILVGHSKTPFISHVLDYIIGKHQFMDRDSKLVLDVMPDVFPKCPDRVAVEFRIDTFIIVYADISEFIPNPFCGDFLCIRSVRIRDDVAVVEIDDFAFSEVFGCAGIRAEPFSKSAVALVDET